MSVRIPTGVGILIILSFILVWLGCMFIPGVAFYLFVGWALFLGRVVPQVAVNPVAVTTGVVCLALFVTGLHLIVGWAYRVSGPAADEAGGGPRRWRVRWTVAIAALVMLTFTAGIAAVGVTHQVGWLATSPDPLLNNGPRGAAARTHSMNNLKQQALALHNHNDEHDGHLPPGFTTDPVGQPLHGWQAQILPYVDEERIYKAIQFDSPWNDPVNEMAMRSQIKVFQRPQGGPAADDAGLALSHYAGNSRVLPGGQGLRIPFDFPDGTSNTILLGEVTAGYRPWGHPLNLRDPAHGLGDRPDQFGAYWSRGAFFAMADGSVRTVSKNVSAATLKAAATPAGNDQLGPDW